MATRRPSCDCLTLRALLIGLTLVPILCAWNDSCDLVAQATEMAVLSLSSGVVFALLVLLGVNALVRVVAPGRQLTRAEVWARHFGNFHDSEQNIVSATCLIAVFFSRVA